MYHLRGVTLSFTMRKWHIYEYPIRKAPSLNREGWGGSPVGVGLPLPLGRAGEGLLSPNPSPQLPVIKRVTPHGEVFLFDATL